MSGDRMQAPACEPGCITCSDQGVPMRVVALLDDDLAACEDESGVAGEVDPALVGPVAPGDVVLVHAGVAIARLGGEAAA